jgi:hypothetical protein
MPKPKPKRAKPAQPAPAPPRSMSELLEEGRRIQAQSQETIRQLHELQERFRESSKRPD